MISIERYRTLADAARTRLETLGYDNVEVVAGDGLAGAPDGRRSIASWSRPPPRRCRKRWSSSAPGRHHGRCRSGRSMAPKRWRGSRTDRGIARTDLIAVRSCRSCPGRPKSYKRRAAQSCQAAEKNKPVFRGAPQGANPKSTFLGATVWIRELYSAATACGPCGSCASRRSTGGSSRRLSMRSSLSR